MSLAKKVLESYGVVEALEIWQMTKYEYEEKFGKPKNNTTVTGGFHPHKEAVETALNQGKKVPSVVLRDYPELYNNEYASKKDSDYIKKSKEKEVIQKVEAFNNVMVKKVEGTNLVTNYVTGTRFALDGVEKMLKEEGIPFSKTKSGTIQITFNKDINESLDLKKKLLTPKVIKKLDDSIKASEYEGNDDVVIESDGIIASLWDTLSHEELKEFDKLDGWEKCEKILSDYIEKNSGKKATLLVESKISEAFSILFDGSEKSLKALKHYFEKEGHEISIDKNNKVTTKTPDGKELTILKDDEVFFKNGRITLKGAGFSGGKLIQIKESLTVPMKFEIAMEKLAKKPVKVRLETMEYALKNMMERATEKTGNNMMIKEFSAHLLSVVQHGFKDIVDDDENNDTMEDDISESEINLKRLLRDKDRIYYNDIGDIKSKGKTLLRVSAKFDQDNTLVIRDHWDEVLFELKKPKTSVGDLLKELDKMGWKTKGMEFSFGESFKESKNESYQPKGKEFNSKEILRDKDRLDGEDFHGQRTRLVVKELSSSEIGIYVLGDTGTHYPLVTLKSPNKTLGDAQKELQKSKIAKNVLIFNESVSESKSFTVKDVKEINSVDELKLAIKYYLDNATKMPYGAVVAFRSQIRSTGEKLGLDLKKLNEIIAEIENTNEALASQVLEAHK